MSKSRQLRIGDLRDIYRLIGDCRDLGADPVLWHGRMLEGLVHLVGASAATVGEGSWKRPGQPPVAVSAFSVGLDARTQENLRAYIRTNAAGGDPILAKFRNIPGRLVVRTRSQLITDAEWCRSQMVNDYLRPSYLNHQLYSLCEVSADHT